MNNLHQIKSFVLRQGRITIAQSKAIAELLPVYGINYQNLPIDLNQAFASNNPKIIEIGFGMGHATWQIAKNNPDIDYLGVEVHGPGVGSLLMEIKLHQLDNLKIIKHDAIEVLGSMIKNQALDGVHIFFPDPWPKKRHHKRRLIQDDFITLLNNKLKTNGYVHIATDCEDYAAWVIDKFAHNTNFKHCQNNPIIASRPKTKFENRGVKLGNKIFDLVYIKK